MLPVPAMPDLTCRRQPRTEPRATAGLLLPLLSFLLLIPLPGLAQRESYMVGPGSSVGPATKVKPQNCVTAPDGAITCDTVLENPPSDTPARPSFELFSN